MPPSASWYRSSFGLPLRPPVAWFCSVPAGGCDSGRGGYGLVLQGGGIGILYLVVFGAGRLYCLLPPLFSQVLMVLLVGLSCLLAVLQNSRSLAFFGSIGGFLAPVLISTGRCFCLVVELNLLNEVLPPRN
jgi:uncharacterized membrane protein